MPGKITYFRIDDFEQRGDFDQFHSECKIDGVVFKKNGVYENKQIKHVLENCRKHNSLGFNTLIVRSRSDLTIWIEQESLPSTESDRQPANVTQINSPTTHSLPTKTVTKRYRGQVYEETVIDWAAVAIQNQGIQTGGKERRKYRGNYID